MLAFHVPGHTPACVAYLIGDALFVGDTLFMPDTGTARCDFPGGDAKSLYESCQRLLTLPDDTRVFVCHDYQPGAEISHSSRQSPSSGTITFMLGPTFRRMRSWPCERLGTRVLRCQP